MNVFQTIIRATLTVAAVAVCTPSQDARAASTPPTISGFKPHSGAVGATVVISGKGFVPPLSVVFGGNSAAAGSFSKTTITVTVPAGAASGPIQVTAAGGSASTAKPFKVTAKRATGWAVQPLSVP